MNRKGLTPVIAVILLLMMTVAAAGAAFFWFVRIQSEMQGGTESYSEQLSESISTKADVSEVDVMDTLALKIILRNIGNAEVPISNTDKVTWILKDYNQDVICNHYWNATAPTETDDTRCETGCETDIGVKGSREVILNISDATHDCYIGSYANNTMFYFKIDFAGTTATGGQFLKNN